MHTVGLTAINQCFKDAQIGIDCWVTVALHIKTVRSLVGPGVVYGMLDEFGRARIHETM